jgi:tetratricopeptide (TPR) repeat protein
MTESEYIKSIRREFAADETAAGKLLGKVDVGLRLFPESAELWCLRGHLIQISDGGEYQLEEALASYEKAVGIDPNYLDVYEEIGYFYDLERQPEKAESYFRKAVALGGGKKTRKALMDVIRQIQAK